MLTHIEFTNNRNALLRAPFGEVPSSPIGYFIKGVEGLGPVTATVSTSTFASMDGEIFEQSRVPARNLVISMGFVPDFVSNSDPYGVLRRRLYPWFAPGSKLTLRFYSDNHETVSIVGYVEAMEPTLFTADPEVQISIICPDPYFSGLTPASFARQGSGTLTVTNAGTANVGFLATVENFATSNVAGFNLRRTSTPTQRMDLQGTLVDGSNRLVMQINTVKGAKSARWKRQTAYVPGGTFGGTSILGLINGWVDLLPGVNGLSVSFVNSTYPTESKLTVTFTPKFVGL